MSKKIFLLGIILISLTLVGCTLPKNLKTENGQAMGFPPPPPQEMRKKLDEACLSGIMQTGSIFFQELNKNAIGKMEKLLFIKEKLESLETNASTQSKPQITKQLTIINTMIAEIKTRDEEVQKDPNIVCNKTEDIQKMNKKLRKKIIGLSGNMRIIREHEENEGALQHMKEMLFGEDPKEDFSDLPQSEEKTRSEEGRNRNEQEKSRNENKDNRQETQK